MKKVTFFHCLHSFNPSKYLFHSPTLGTYTSRTSKRIYSISIYIFRMLPIQCSGRLLFVRTYFASTKQSSIQHAITSIKLDKCIQNSLQSINFVHFPPKQFTSNKSFHLHPKFLLHQIPGPFNNLKPHFFARQNLATPNLKKKRRNS